MTKPLLTSQHLSVTKEGTLGKSLLNAIFAKNHLLMAQRCGVTSDDIRSLPLQGRNSIFQTKGENLSEFADQETYSRNKQKKLDVPYSLYKLNRRTCII